MEKESEKLNINIEKMVQALEKAQDAIAENIDNLLVQMGELETSIQDLKRMIAKPNTTSSSIVDDDTIEDDEEGKSSLEELNDFDADDDLSDDDLKNLGYDIK